MVSPLMNKSGSHTLCSRNTGRCGMAELGLDELRQLEELLKKACDIGAYPFFGRIETIWQADQVVRIDKHDQRKIDRGRK